ncbi:class I SAM-dependent methyltransferase [Roseovarius faecimaris]|uniref:Class I SAM-dependent methyltransferase n=1 Tax=Roseovarius faecimaris TaxID=2494550 RepID=A0A6I6ITK1_9RHOB|nr:class I SAM-dependent methyltransferase [Roseovarius faecimaris]QGX99414.1 class I SAM-dependent methyltransferase [Roseovarius faecimaris]
MSRDDETLSVYAARADDYLKMVEKEAESPILAAFIGGLPKGAHVLDLGCGPGVSAAVMAQSGLTVEATDAVPEMVERAAANPGVMARLATFDDITGTDLYDGIWANFSLLHAPKADMPGHLARLRAALKPGGLFHIGMKTGSGEHRDSIGRFYAYYTEEELCDLLTAAGFKPFSSTRGNEPGLSGEPAPWVCIAAHG